MKGSILYLAVGVAMVLVEGDVDRLRDVGAWLDVALWPMWLISEAMNLRWLAPHRLEGWSVVAIGCAVLGFALSTINFEAFRPAEKELTRMEQRRRAATDR